MMVLLPPPPEAVLITSPPAIMVGHCTVYRSVSSANETRSFCFSVGCGDRVAAVWLFHLYLPSHWAKLLEARPGPRQGLRECAVTAQRLSSERGGQEE